mgnify:CR=1 FL=1
MRGGSVWLCTYVVYASGSDYAEDGMGGAVGSGEVKCSGVRRSPKNNATRAGVAVMVHRYRTK